MVSTKTHYKAIANLLKQFDHHLVKYQNAKKIHNEGLVMYYDKEIESFVMQLRHKFSLLNPNQPQTQSLQQQFDETILLYHKIKG